MRLFALTAFLMGSALGAAAQQDAGSPWIETRFERVHLRNGNTIDGRLVRDSKGSVVLKLKVGEMEIRRDMIERVELVRMRSLKEIPEVRPDPRKEPTKVEAVSAPEIAEKPEKPTAPRSAAELAPGVAKETRETIDTIIHGWLAAPSESRGDLASKLDPLPDDAVAYLCALLDEKPRKVPATPICDVLGKKRDVSSIPSLARVLENSPMQDRAAAATALGRIGTPDCLPGLMKSLNDPSTPVWRAAIEALAPMAKNDPQLRIVDQITTDLSRTSQKGSYALALSTIGGDDAYRALIDLLRSGNDGERMAVLPALAKILAPADADLVMPCLSSANSQVRKEACVVLGTVKHRGAVRELIDLLTDADTGLIINAHKALQQITGENLARDANLWRQWWEVAGKDKFQK